ncbi:MAG: flippase-like domain-containing protein [Bacteroidetes bacterium]|nr:flippase-like domain-containing protein [Bacteroidota bacterium]
MKKGLGFFLKTFIPLGIGVYLIWYFFTSMSSDSIEQFKIAFREADYLYLFLSVLFGFISLISRSLRWGYVLEPLGYKVPFWHRYHALMIGYVVNLTIPRAGEASRAAMLYRSDKVPFSKSFGTIVAERAVDLLLLASIGLFTMYVGAGDFELIWKEMLTKFGAKPENSSHFPWKYLFLGILFIIALVVFRRFRKNEKFRTKIIEFIQGLMGGLFSIFKSTRPVGYIFHTLLIWGCYIAMFGICFYALDSTSEIPMKGILIGFVAGSIGITFTNGGIGSYPLLVGLVIAFYLKADHPDSAEGIGNALGMIIWVFQTLMMILLGLISMVLLPKNYSTKNDKTAKDSIEN